MRLSSCIYVAVTDQRFEPCREIHAFIYDATVLEYNAGRDEECDLITVGKWYAMTGYGVGFPKGSQYIGEVNKVILDLQMNGKIKNASGVFLVYS